MARLGRVSVPATMYEDFSRLTPGRVLDESFNAQTQCHEYLIESDQFRDLSEGENVPSYRVEIQDSGGGLFSLRFTLE